MARVIALPQLMAAAAADLANADSAFSAARAAARPTTSLVAAAGDEVSAAIARWFADYGRGYQAVLRQAAEFHAQFVVTLNAAGNAYAEAEAAASNALGTLETRAATLLGAAATTATTAADTLAAVATTVPTGDSVTTLIMGATGYPVFSNQIIDILAKLYVNPLSGVLQGLTTPEQFWPDTPRLGSLTYDQSVAQGVAILNNAIQALAPGTGNIANVFGYSQSAVVASLEMRLLDPTNLPYPLGTSIPTGSLNFSLVGDPSNPNGGLLARFPGLTIPSLGLTFGTTTPDDSFPAKIFTIEYDGYGDFPQYPIDVLSDLNAFFGIATLHGTYPYLTADQVSSAIQLTNTVGPTLDQYYIIPTQNLPLLDPVRAIPVIGNPIADLVQPDLRVLVDLGYGSTTQGWSTGPPNVATPFGVISPVSPTAIASALVHGTQQGISAFVGDVSAGLAGIPAAPDLSLSSLTSMLGSVGTGGWGSLPTLTCVLPTPQSVIAALQSAEANIVNAVTNASAAAYATLLPTAALTNALVTAMPSYDVTLFLNGMTQVADGDLFGGLIYAFGAPIAADVALGTFAGSFEFEVLAGAAATIIEDFSSLL